MIFFYLFVSTNVESCCIIGQIPWRAKHLIPWDVDEKFCIHYFSQWCDRISDRKELKERFNLDHFFRRKHFFWQRRNGNQWFCVPWLVSWASQNDWTRTVAGIWLSRRPSSSDLLLLTPASLQILKVLQSSKPVPAAGDQVLKLGLLCSGDCWISRNSTRHAFHRGIEPWPYLNYLYQLV